MNSLCEVRVNMKAYRTWYKLNKNTVISVITPAGLSEKAEAGGIMAQGSRGAALASALWAFKKEIVTNLIFCPQKIYKIKYKVIDR